MSTISKTRKIEKAVVSAIVKSALGLGYTISVWDGGETVVHKSTKYRVVMDACFSTGEDVLTIWNGAVRLGFVFLVYGNSGYDVISDYSTALEPVLEKANAVADNYDLIS